MKKNFINIFKNLYMKKTKNSKALKQFKRFYYVKIQKSEAINTQLKP